YFLSRCKKFKNIHVVGRLLTRLSFPLQNGTLHFCGFQVLAPQIFWSPAHCPPAVRTAMLEGWRARLKGLLSEKPLTFAPCELFDLSFQGGFRLWPKVREERESQPYGITTGHHLGKPLPPDNQITAPPNDDPHTYAPPTDDPH
ncbi:NAD(P)H dehydrogenase [quinone] 1-like, partial [Plectropomus leopardus]|uniref:NAD(P)H dehydrogenase [quinone] 1-like n=1 Tax=Plectropomus leopardus TaxID=160734 RepID=UPI001C4B8EEE